MRTKTRGIVVRTVRYGERSVIANVFTEQLGMVGFMVKPRSKRRDPQRSLLLSPLAIVELDFDYRDNRALSQLDDVRIAVPYASLPYNPVKQAIALFLGEFLFHALRNEQANEGLFGFVVASLQWLDLSEGSFANFPLTFLLRLTRYLGIWPSVEEACSLAGEGERELVPLVLRMDFASMHLFRMSREQRRRLLRLMTDYYRLHVDGFPTLRSPEVLHEVLG